MLAKDPEQRITAKKALNHEWILSGGAVSSSPTHNPYQLCSAQENMRKFQEEYCFSCVV